MRNRVASVDEREQAEREAKSFEGPEEHTDMRGRTG